MEKGREGKRAPKQRPRLPNTVVEGKKPAKRLRMDR